MPRALPATHRLPLRALAKELSLDLGLEQVLTRPAGRVARRERRVDPKPVSMLRAVPIFGRSQRLVAHSAEGIRKCESPGQETGALMCLFGNMAVATSRQ